MPATRSPKAGREISERFRASYKEKEGIHTRLMRKYPDILSWWFYILLAVTFTTSLMLCKPILSSFTDDGFIHHTKKIVVSSLFRAKHTLCMFTNTEKDTYSNPQFHII